MVFTATVPARVDLPTSDTLPRAVAAAASDAATIVSRMNCSHSTALSVPRVQLEGNRTAQAWNFTVDVAVFGPEAFVDAPGFCDAADKAAKCVALAVAALSFNAQQQPSMAACTQLFPRTVAVLNSAPSSSSSASGLASLASGGSSSGCVLGAAVTTGDASACDAFADHICPAAQSLDRDRFTPPPLPTEPFCDKFPCVIVGASLGGLLVLVAVVLLLRKYLAVNTAEFGRASLFEVTDDSPNRQNANFNGFYNFADASVLNAAATFDEDDGTGAEEMLLAHQGKTQGAPAAAAAAAAQRYDLRLEDSDGGFLPPVVPPAPESSAAAPEAAAAADDDDSFLPPVRPSRAQMMEDI